MTAIRLLSLVLMLTACRDLPSAPGELIAPAGQTTVNQTPRQIYTRALAAIDAGNMTAAMRQMRQLATMGLSLKLSGSERFAGLRSAPGYDDLLAAFAGNGEPVERSEEIVALEQKDFWPEGVAFDPTTGYFYLSSIRHREIWRIRPGEPAVRIAGREKGLGAVFGMRIDGDRLLAATGRWPDMQGYFEGDPHFAAIIEFDLRNGQVLAEHRLTNTEKDTLLGDLLIAADGRVYTTDGVGGIVYQLDRENSTFTPLAEGFRSPQGIVDWDDETLIMADYSAGLVRIDRRNGEHQLIDLPATTASVGTDGLYRYGGELIAIQNGISPMRIVAFRLSNDGSRVLSERTIERNHREWIEITLGTIHDGALYYVANSLWPLVEDHQLPDESELEGPVIRSVLLK